MAMRSRVRSYSYHGETPMEVLRAALIGSMRSWALIIGECPVALWGLVSEGCFSPKAYVWAMMSEDVAKNPRLVAMTSKKFINQIRTEVPYLETTTDAEYPLADKWVRWLGFQPAGEVRPGINRYTMGAL